MTSLKIPLQFPISSSVRILRRYDDRRNSTNHTAPQYVALIIANAAATHTITTNVFPFFSSVPSPEVSGPPAEVDPKMMPVPAAATRTRDADPRLVKRAPMVTRIRGGRMAKKATEAKSIMPVVMAPIRMRANMNLETVPVSSTRESMLDPKTATRGTETFVAPMTKELGMEFEIFRRPGHLSVNRPPRFLRVLQRRAHLCSPSRSSRRQSGRPTWDHRRLQSPPRKCRSGKTCIHLEYLAGR